MTPERKSKLFELLSTGSDDPLLKAEAAIEYIGGCFVSEIEENEKLRAVNADMLALFKFICDAVQTPVVGHSVGELNAKWRAIREYALAGVAKATSLEPKGTET